MTEPRLLDKRTQKELTYYLPDAEMTEKLAGLFALFADRSRLRMLSALSISEMCVTDLACVLKMNQTTVSHQLQLLRNTGMVVCKRQGKTIFYRLATDKINQVMLSGVEYLGF